MANFRKAHTCSCEADKLMLFSDADFKSSQAKVAKHEGGYQALSWDTGNYVDGQLIGTNWGIAAPTLKEYLGRTPSVSDMKNLSYATALKIYKSQYWDPIQGDAIKNQSVADIIYDGSVNYGVAGMKKIVKDSLGVPYNVSTLNSMNQKKVFEEIKKGREKKYRELGGQALTAWMNRLNSFAYSSVASIKKHPIVTIVLTTSVAVAIYLLCFNRETRVFGRK